MHELHTESGIAFGVIVGYFRGALPAGIVVYSHGNQYGTIAYMIKSCLL